jgi:hypothetical protein
MSPMEELTERAQAELKERMRYAHDNNIPLHYRRCANCELRGTIHVAEFMGLRDEDGSRMLNFVGEDPVVAMIWVNFNGCVTFRPKVSVS